jgi:hypothetical protein
VPKGGKQYDKTGKAVKYARLEELPEDFEETLKPISSSRKSQEISPLQADFDEYLEKTQSSLGKKINKKSLKKPAIIKATTPIKDNAIVPKPAATPTPTRIKNSIFSPSIQLSNLKPQKYFHQNHLL